MQHEVGKIYTRAGEPGRFKCIQLGRPKYDGNWYQRIKEDGSPDIDEENADDGLRNWHSCYLRAEDLPPMTIEEVKEYLPDVLVSVGGQIYPAYTAGRQYKYCTVCNPAMKYQEEFSWAAVTRSINERQPLKG